eukprot:gene2606-2992_t
MLESSSLADSADVPLDTLNASHKHRLIDSLNGGQKSDDVTTTSSSGSDNDDEEDDDRTTRRNHELSPYSPHDKAFTNKFTLTSYANIPPYLQGNEFIVTGYRVNFTYALCAKSIFRMHNETLNIWTHLLGTIAFFILMIVTLTSLLDNPTPMDKFVFVVFFICAQCQMLFSALFHTFCSVSGRSYLWWARLDYTGISLMITARFRVVRAVFFIVFGFFIVIPMPHILAIESIAYIWPVFWRLLIMGGIYVAGATIYATRCPECCMTPGKLDYGFSSHVIWHCFTIVAALFQLYNCIFAYNHYGNSCPVV